MELEEKRSKLNPDRDAMSKRLLLFIIVMLVVQLV